jgi:hypothetical protein
MIMSMKSHILAAMKEQFDQLDQLLASLKDEHATAPSFDDDWSVKDVVNHLWGWQQISVARLNAGVLDREPEFPNWLTGYPGNWDENADETNAWIYEDFHKRSWAEARTNWSDGFLRLLELGEKVSERDLLDGSRYAWLNGYSLAFILIACYEHHQEHLEKLTAWLVEGRNKS